MGLSQPSHGLVRRHRTGASVLDAGETSTCGLGLLDCAGTAPMGLGVKGSRVQIPPSRLVRGMLRSMRRTEGDHSGTTACIAVRLRALDTDP